ncbi:hypothetical protein RN22_13195 [Grimontia sp. AD028]|uniref:YaaC family protein n=1 Tax=Grimontia sp. AD028 TaxID=1581149 RepID=UPI00061A9A2B|nr:YaaC family protein [Grimontia sp. AD028]KKD59993.1 hypothetical protein RN22_13195 [Grimontia sp. AD028]
MEWITCENTYEESWRRLLEFANVELAIDAISSIHGEPSKSTLPNYKKQAEQARVALLQAKEYFEAAKASSLYTQPNHLYYGSVALSTACMLIRGDGRKSLDFLRKNSKNSSHGLDFTFSSDIRKSKIGLSLLDNSYVKICPNGHFANWYDTLQSTQRLTAIKHLRTTQGSQRNMEYVGNFQIPEFSDLKGIKKDLMFLLTRLPDLYTDLGRYGVSVDSARGEFRVYRDEVIKQEYNEFIFHSSPSPEGFLKVIENFTCEDGVNFEYEFFDGSTSGFVRSRKDKLWAFSFPDSRTTLDHKTIYYADPLATPEVVDLFLVSYVLSMLSRYFPDIWISFLESHCKGAKLVERIVRVLTLKMPNLMLNQITGSELVISNHRPPWH